MNTSNSTPNATITSTIPVGDFTGLNAGESTTSNINMGIDLHGTQISRNAKVKVTRSADNVFEVSSLGPILVHASQFALADGVEALRKIAGLQSIELMVPVTFDLRLVAKTVAELMGFGDYSGGRYECGKVIDSIFKD